MEITVHALLDSTAPSLKSGISLTLYVKETSRNIITLTTCFSWQSIVIKGPHGEDMERVSIALLVTCRDANDDKKLKMFPWPKSQKLLTLYRISL